MGFPVAAASGLIYWILRRLDASLNGMNGKLDQLGKAVEENTNATKDLCANIKSRMPKSKRRRR